MANGFFLLVYFVTTIVAALRLKRNKLGIVLVNVLDGWIIIGG